MYSVCTIFVLLDSLNKTSHPNNYVLYNIHVCNFLSVCHSVLHVYNFWCIFVYRYYYVEGIWSLL